MKRFLLLLLILCLCLSFAGCDAKDYTDAMDYYEQGQYQQALELFTSLGDYADSKAMAALCQQFIDYADAQAFFAAGDYQAALDLFSGLRMYKDSPVMVFQCQYHIGMAHLAAGEYQQAIQWLEPLGNFEDCRQQVELAKWQYLHQHITANGGTITIPVGEDANTQLLLQAEEDGVLTLVYMAEGQLLGLPYLHELTIPLALNQEQTSCQVVYRSSLVTQVEEIASGVVLPGALSTSSGLSIDSFQQTITDENGETQISNDLSSSVMIQAITEAAQQAFSQYLPALLETTGTDVTPKDLGLLSLT